MASRMIFFSDFFFIATLSKLVYAPDKLKIINQQQFYIGMNMNLGKMPVEDAVIIRNSELRSTLLTLGGYLLVAGLTLAVAAFVLA